MPTSPDSSRKQDQPLFSVHRASLLRENGLELNIVWQLKSHQGKILTQETGLLGGIRTDIKQAQAGRGAGVSLTFPRQERSEQVLSGLLWESPVSCLCRILGRIHLPRHHLSKVRALQV